MGIAGNVMGIWTTSGVEFLIYYKVYGDGLWVKTYEITIWGNRHPFTSYDFGVGYQGFDP